ncbi:MAG: hypothetical protein MI866_16275 [Bacteroidales bacterium]|nr:hypothetical protein [Bacteroidales bacterium]
MKDSNQEDMKRQIENQIILHFKPHLTFINNSLVKVLFINMNQYNRSTKLVLKLTFLMLIISHTALHAQQSEKAERTQMPLLYYSYMDSFFEVYRYNSHQSQLSFTSNGTIKLSTSHYLNIEFILCNTLDNDHNSFTVGDLSLTYSRNFYSDHFLDNGFQGFNTAFKIILPTGKSKYLSGFDNWIIEPSIYYGWIFKNSHLFVTNKLRLFTSLGCIGEVKKIHSYIRYEPKFGYENNNFWLSFHPDLRVLINPLQRSLLLGLEAGLKLTSKTGIILNYKKNITDVRFYDRYFALGYYIIL